MFPFIQMLGIGGGQHQSAGESSTLTNGLLWYLRFNDDDLTDSSDEGNDATGLNSPAYATDAERGRVLDLTAGATVGATAGTSLAADTSYTKAAWIKVDSVGGNHNIISSDEGAQKHVFWFNGATLEVRHNFTVVASFADAGLTVGEWMHVVATYDEPTETLKIYKNGFEVASATSVAAPNLLSGIQIGLFNGANGIDGYMDDVRFYDRALTADEVDELHTLEYSSLTPTRVMPLGDSLVYGLNGNDGWRMHVYDQRVGDAPATSINFVGGESDGGFGDDDHQGHSGQTLAQVIDTHWAASNDAYDPGIVVFMAGTNDVTPETETGAEIAARLDTDLADITAKSYVDTVLVCSIAPRNPSDGDKATITSDFNAELPGVCDNHTKCTFVDAMEFVTYNTSGDMDPDTIHLSTEGYTKAGIIIYDAIKTALGNFVPRSISGLDFSLKFVDPWISYETGTSTDLKRIDSVRQLATSGDTMAQSTSANKPVVTSFPEGTVAYFDGSNDSLASSEASSSWDYLSSSAWTIGIACRPHGTASDTTLLDTSGDNLSNRGLRLSVNGTDVIAEIFNGSGSTNSQATWTGALSAYADTTHTLVFKYNGTDSCTLYVDGTSQGAETLTASAGSAGGTLTLGSTVGGADYYEGYIAEVLMYDSALSDSDRASVETYLERWVMAVTYAQLIEPAVAALYGGIASIRSGGSASEDRFGTYSGVDGAGVLFTTSASYNNRDVMSFAGSSDTVDYDGIAGDIDGDDTPFTWVTIGNAGTISANRTMLSLGNSSGGIHHVQQIRSDASHESRRDDGTSEVSISSGTANTDPAVYQLAFRGAEVTLARDDTVDVHLSSHNTGSCTFNRFTLGSWRTNSAINPWTGIIAECYICTRYLNKGDRLAVAYPLQQYYGV